MSSDLPTCAQGPETEGDGPKGASPTRRWGVPPDFDGCWALANLARVTFPRMFGFFNSTKFLAAERRERGSGAQGVQNPSLTPSQKETKVNSLGWALHEGLPGVIDSSNHRE